MMKVRQTKRTFIQFLAYYLLIALLPLICIALLYCNDMLETTRSYLSENLAGATQNAMRSVESHLSIIQGYPLQLAQSNTVRDYRYVGTSINRLALISELKRTVGGNDMIVNLLVYFRNSETFVSAYANSWNRQSLLAGKLLIYENINAAAYIDLLDNLKGEQVLPLAMVQPITADVKREMVTFLQTLPANNRYAYACVITLVSGAKLRQLLQADDVSVYLLVDSSGQVIVSESSIPGQAERVLDLLPGGICGAEQIALDGDEMILSWCRSASFGYTLVRAASMQAFIDQRNNIFGHMAITLVILSLLIALLIMLFMRQTFTPIRDLAAIALRSGREASADGDTAFSVIKSALRSLETENIQLSTHLEKQNPILAEYAARTLLSTPEEHWNQKAFADGLGAGLRLNCAAYQVIVLQFACAQDQVDALKNVIEYCGKDYVASFPETLQNRIALLLGYSEKRDVKDGPPPLHVMKLRAAGLGPLVNNVKEWNASYIRASLACDCAADTREEGRIMRFEDIPCEMYTPNYPWESLQMLAAAINQSNTPMVRAAEAQLKAYMSRCGRASDETVRSVFLQVLQLCQNVLPDHVEQIREYVRMLKLQPDAITGQDMADTLDEMLDAFCQREECDRAHRESSPIYRSLSIISEEIGSENLSLAYVAECVGLSPSRYSARFPQEMNRNFKEYVDSLRLNLAKQLLRTTDMQVNDIAAKVGYQNAYSFARFFKSKTNQTPNEYRERARSGAGL